MELSLDGTTVVARLAVGPPILSFFAVTDTLTLNASDYNRALQLCCVNLLAHGLRSGRTTSMSRRGQPPISCEL
jgi:hypothetical protein